MTYVGSLGVLFLLLGRFFPELLRDAVQVLGLILLLYAAVAWVRHLIAQGETRTTEKLLEIERAWQRLVRPPRRGHPPTHPHRLISPQPEQLVEVCRGLR